MKKAILIPTIGVATILITVGVPYTLNKVNLKNEKETKELLIKNIKNNYNQFIKVKDDTEIYGLIDNEYVKVGSLSKNNEFELDVITTEDNEYFRIKNTDYYLKYTDVTPIEALTKIDTRYQNFIAFAENIIITPNSKITDENNNYLSLNTEISVPIIIKEENKYGFEYLGKLYYVSKDDVTITEGEKANEKTASKVLTLTYHFIYDPVEKDCNQSICQTLEQFESHLKYLKDNNFFVMKLEELEMYLDGKVNIPKNSIVLTIDDGYISEKAIRLLEEYETYATLFVITGHFKSFDKFQSPYLALESHTDGMHKQYACKGMGNQGGGILCLVEETALADLKLSQEKINGSTYFAYPFFDYNNRAIEILKKAGFKMAFIGQSSTNGFSKPGINKYKIPRKTVFSNTNVDKLKEILNS